MLQFDDQAIVLRCYNQKVSLLSKKKGHFQALLFDNNKIKMLRPGTSIAYTLSCTYKNYHYLDSITIEIMPFEWAVHDIQFLHALLEICYFFIPVDSSCSAVFFILQRLYDHFKNCNSIFLQKIMICKLLVHLSIVPDDLTFQNYVELFLKTDVDKIHLISLQLDSEDLLNDWILWLIRSNPQGKWLKATPLLLKVKSYEK